MTIRSEIEARLKGFADTKGLPVAFEGAAFTPPTNSPYLRLFLLDKDIFARDVSVKTKTTIGMFQIDVCCPDKKGSKEVEELAEQIAELFPYADKQSFPTISIENYPQIGRAMIEGNFRVVPITVEYRQ